MNPNSVYANMSMPELRMWALHGLLCNPHMLENADGSNFLPNEVSWSIFESARVLVENGLTAEYSDIFVASGGRFDVAVSLSALPDFKIDENQAAVYLKKLEERME